MNAGVCGTNAICFKFKDGIITGIDTGANYGRLSIKDTNRIMQVTDNCVAAFSGLMSDISFLKKLIREELEADNMRKMDPQGIHKMVQRILYAKRSQGRPLSVSVIISGINRKQNKIFDVTDENGRMIGVANSKGNFWFDESVALSFASNFALPLIRDKKLDEMSREEAVSFMEECLRVMCYRDTRSTNRIQISISDFFKTEVLEPYCIKTDWNVGLTDNETVL